MYGITQFSRMKPSSNIILGGIRTSPKESLYRVEHVTGGIDVTYRIPAGYRFADGSLVPDKLVKQHWRVIEGKLELADESFGKVIPERFVPEVEEWETVARIEGQTK